MMHNSFTLLRIGTIYSRTGSIHEKVVKQIGDDICGLCYDIRGHLWI